MRGVGMIKLKACPMELKDANAFVESLHRHHAPVHRDKFRIGCKDNNDVIHGVVQCARPVSRVLDDGLTIEVVRLCSDGTDNVCSFLYSRAARIAKEMGYTRIITYILQSEDGASLRASGWSVDKENVGGGSWDAPSRRRDVSDHQLDLWGKEKQKYSIEKKTRYVKYL
jgi:hypothetical protein